MDFQYVSDFREVVICLFSSLLHNALLFSDFYGHISCFHCQILYDLQISLVGSNCISF